MREHFGLREELHGYPLIEVIIVTRRYRLSKMPFVLVSVSFWGGSYFRAGSRSVVNIWLPFCVFLENKSQNTKKVLHTNLLLTCG